jgi:hypothetical protein
LRKDTKRLSGFAYSDLQAVKSYSPWLGSFDPAPASRRGAMAAVCPSATLISGDETLRLSNP